jgi:hypothetical protein
VHVERVADAGVDRRDDARIAVVAHPREVAIEGLVEDRVHLLAFVHPELR